MDISTICFIFCLLSPYPATSNEDSELEGTYRSSIEVIVQQFARIISPSEDNPETGQGFLNSMISTALAPIKFGLQVIDVRPGEAYGEILNAFRDKIPQQQAVLIGTKWCGDGDVAASDDDVGLFHRTDACCRAHDKCPTSISAGDTLGPLKNDALFTRSHCSCDQEFYNCLKQANSPIATQIGVTYFNILRPQCFIFSHPIAFCTKTDVLDITRVRLTKSKCLEYVVDPSQEETYIWKDNPNF